MFWSRPMKGCENENKLQDPINNVNSLELISILVANIWFNVLL